MATLLSICQDATRDLGTHLVPSTIANNTDATAELCLSLVNRLGRELALKYDFEILLAEATFSTVASTASYSLASDFRKFARMTQWDRGQYQRIVGPVSPSQWQAFQSANVNASAVSYFRVQGGTLNLYPTPASVYTVAYEYYSKNWCETSVGTGQTAFAADTDVPLLDDELLILGLKARFLRSRGEPYDEAMEDYNSYRDSLIANDNGPGAICFGSRVSVFGANIPDTGYGA